MPIGSDPAVPRAEPVRCRLPRKMRRQLSLYEPVRQQMAKKRFEVLKIPKTSALPGLFQADIVESLNAAALPEPAGRRQKSARFFSLPSKMGNVLKFLLY